MRLYLKILVPVLVLSLAVHFGLTVAGRIDSIGLWYLLLSAFVYAAGTAAVIYAAAAVRQARLGKK